MNEAGLPVAAWLGPRSAPSFVLAAQCSAVQHGHLAATAAAVLRAGRLPPVTRVPGPPGLPEEVSKWVTMRRVGPRSSEQPSRCLVAHLTPWAASL